MKVLHVSAGAERGGLEVVLLNILRFLDRSRFIPHVLFLQDGPFVREVQETATDTHVINAGRVREIVKAGKAIARAVQLIRDRGIDLVHSHNAKAHIYGGLAAAIAGVPGLYHLHGVPKLRFSRDGLVSLLSVAVPARQTVACSAYVARTFRRAWRSRRDLLVVHNGTTPESVAAASPLGVREEFGIPDGAPVIVMATRLQRWKGVHVLLEAVAQVARTYPEARLIIVGGTLFGLDEDYPPELHQQVRRLKLEKAARFVGFRSDIFRFYAAADLVIHCSIEPEPFGMVLLEAMSCGKPVVASDTGGPPEIVEAGVTGLLVPPKDAGRLARAILDLLDDPDRRVRMGLAAAARVRERFGAERMVRRFEEIYAQMVDDKVPQ